jgi:presenilin-like A22 family membrane protease
LYYHKYLGLWLISQESIIDIDAETNMSKVSFSDTAIGARPETTGSGSLIYILIAIAIGTGLVLMIVKFGKTNIWRTWFFLAVSMAIAVSLGVLIKKSVFFTNDIAIVLAILLASWKIFRPNVVIHNITEVFMYAGIGLIIVPLFDWKWALILLVIISLYDMYAVWKSKHMVKMAEFQTKSNVFAGLMIPYRQSSSGKTEFVKPLRANAKTSSNKVSPKIRAGKTSPKNAILGGGDIAFPLIFIGAVMNGILLKLYNANPSVAIEILKSTAFLHSSIIVFTSAIALTLLFVFAKKGRFYPAMPFITGGCIVGWLITLLL